MRPLRRASLLALVAVALGAAPIGAQTPNPTPLAGFAGQRVAVLPLQLLAADTSEWGRGGSPTALKRAFDDSLTALLTERGIGTAWAYAADILRGAKRNPTYAGDPTALGAQLLRFDTKDGAVGDPFASRLRTQLALADARYALVPVRVLLQPKGRARRAVLVVALIDGRRSVILWSGEVTSDETPSLDAATLGSLARRVADLVVSN
ncbi:MAG: hypothetical protein K2X99_04960 [Gemmatimonadaceae bacterium]|nr:hypothetical protein [Gemmatimonadaceae bacterium]